MFNWNQFRKNLESYLRDQYNVEITRYQVDHGRCEITVTDEDHNDTTWIMNDWETYGDYTNLPVCVVHHKPQLIHMICYVDSVHYECMVPAYAWVVGSIIMS